MCWRAVKDNTAGRDCVSCVCTHCGDHTEIKDLPANKDGALCSAAGVKKDDAKPAADKKETLGAAVPHAPSLLLVAATMAAAGMHAFM